MKKRTLGAIALLVLALGLTSCTKPTDAASFASGHISVDRLQQSVSTILKERIEFNTTPQDGLTGEALTRNQLEFHIFTALLTQAAKERNIFALPSEVAAKKADILKNVGGEKQLSVAMVNAGIASIDLDQYLSLIVLQDKLKKVVAPNATDDNQVIQALQKMIADTVVSQKLQVNPRYGVWNVVASKVEPADPTGGALKKSSSQ